MSHRKILFLSWFGDTLIFFLCSVAGILKTPEFTWMYTAMSYPLYLFVLLVSRTPISYMMDDVKKFASYFLKMSFAMMSSIFLLSYFYHDFSQSSIFYFFSLMIFLIAIRLTLTFYAQQENENPVVLIVGGGEATELLIKEMKHQGTLSKVLGIVDDDPKKKNLYIQNIPVIGTTLDVEHLTKTYAINEIIISIEKANSEVIHRVLDQVDTKKVMTRIIPTEREILFKSLTFSQVRTIVPEDLLGRTSQNFDSQELSDYFRDKTVLITGAGGSIGSEIVNQLLFLPVKQLICVSRGEFSLYSLQRNLSKLNIQDTAMKFFLGNVQDMARMEELFSQYKPHIVFHAAAYKHVPLLESQEKEAIKNNVVGTDNLLKLSEKHGVSNFVLVSTDKAVHPTSVMGASKRMAEILCEYYYQAKGLHACAVRFGNVLGSRGSVVPLFQEQIAMGGPVTVTHPKVTRYFMTIPEAAQLVITASALSSGGEKFILDMGKPIKIDDLVKKMIRLLGFEPGKDIKIEYTGLRPGEKLHEELIINEEKVSKTSNDRIFLSQPSASAEIEQTHEKIVHLCRGIETLTSDEIRQQMRVINPMYKEIG